MGDRTLRPLLPGLVLLAVHPALWLVRTWFDPAYGSSGGLIFAACVALVVLSLRSGPASAERRVDMSRALFLVLCTALVRIAGQLLDFNVLGAFALVIDVYALALALGLAHRRFALAPAGLAALFALSLPIGRMAERAFGYPLQLVSARGACGALRLLHDDLSCVATSIQVDGASLSIDLPCSGARGMVNIAAFLLILATLRRLRGRRLVVGALLGVVAALVANAFRIAILAEGILAGIDVLGEPMHSLVGLIALAIGVAPLFFLAQRPTPPDVTTQQDAWLPPMRPIGAALFAIAVIVMVLPAKPVDVSGPVAPLALPTAIEQVPAKAMRLSEKEQTYVDRFGGQIERARYGEHVVMAVRTSAPLRHLHPPTDCLRGAGHESRLLGVTTERLAPTAVYRSEAPNGDVWRVEVSYVSEKGVTATSGAEVAWRWLQEPGVAWTMIQRITPFERCERAPGDCDRFDRALLETYVDGSGEQT